MHRTQNLPSPAADTDGFGSVTPADILRGASTYLIRHGWNRGNYYGGRDTTPFPPADVIGAIGMAAYGNRHHLYSPDAPPEGTRLFRRAFDYFCDFIGRTDPMCRLSGDQDIDLDLELSPYVWNDDPARHGLQVVMALTQAATDFDRTHGGTR
ncbi:hypothetical protein AB0M20_07970 [Actinoplanes sp. NPDC051633]|uniref:DUF6197 family protein n=1 Tax=Actinoplanes sp. NPDC051633 TaxID=3155670 RepID=UPI003430BE09